MTLISFLDAYIYVFNGLQRHPIHRKAAYHAGSQQTQVRIKYKSLLLI